MTQFIVLSPVDMVALQKDKPIIITADSKSYTLISEEGFNKQAKAIEIDEITNQIHEVEELDFGVQMVDHWTDREYKLHDLYMSKLQELKKAYKEVTGNEYAED